MASLIEYFNSPDQSVRLKAALTAGTFPNSSYIQTLITQCAVEPDPFVRDTLSWALMRHDRDQVLDLLQQELHSPNQQAKSQALHTLSKIGDSANYALITLAHLLDADDVVAITAWRAASVLVPEPEKEALVRILVSQLGTGDGDKQFALTRFLCTIGKPIVEPLLAASKSGDEEVRIHAEITLIRFRELELEFNKKLK